MTILGFLVPVAVYFWFIHQYAVNMIWKDQWADIDTISRSYSHTLDLSTLWGQYAANRILFPRLVVLALAHTTHFNVLVEDYLSGIFLVLATTLFVLAHRRRSPTTPWISYVPVAFAMLSLVQWQNTLWGFQMAWYLVMLALAAAMFLLDRQHLGWWGGAFSAAIVAAVVGSFSSLQGLLIWPAGFVLLYYRRRTRAQIAIWIAAAVATGIVYFHNFDFKTGYLGGSPSYPFTHPFSTITFYLSAIGMSDVVLGLVIFLLSTFVLVAYWPRRDADRGNGAAIGVALVWFGLLFAATVTEGRSSKGFGGLASYYAMFDMLVLVGCYLALLDQPTLRLQARRSDPSARSFVYHDGPMERLLGLPTASSPGRPRDKTLLLGAQAIAIAAIFLAAIVGGITNGLTPGRAFHRTELRAVEVTKNINRVPDRVVVKSLLQGGPASSAGYIRQLVPVAERYHLSLFDADRTAGGDRHR